MTPFIKHKADIRGFVCDVTDGLLREVTLGYSSPATGDRPAEGIDG